MKHILPPLIAVLVLSLAGSGCGKKQEAVPQPPSAAQPSTPPAALEPVSMVTTTMVKETQPKITEVPAGASTNTVSGVVSGIVDKAAEELKKTVPADMPKS